MSKKTAQPQADADIRVQDGEQQHRIRTTNGLAFLLRQLVASGGWYQGAKEFARARKLARAIPKMTPPSGNGTAAWEAKPCQFWLSDRLRTHGAKCLNFYLDKGALAGTPDDEGIEDLLIRFGISLKDD